MAPKKAGKAPSPIMLLNENKWISVISTLLPAILLFSVGIVSYTGSSPMTWSPEQTNSLETSIQSSLSPSYLKDSTFPKTSEDSSSSKKVGQKERYGKSDPRQKSKKVVSHFHLVFAWPPGVCVSNVKCWPETKVSKFYLHGLWPTYNDGRHKTNCRPLPYKETKEDDDYVLSDEPSTSLGEEMVDVLHEVFPSYERKEYANQRESSPWFWRHQYNKHGSCVQELGIGLTEYFERVSKLAQLNLADGFSEILETRTTTHNVEEFKRALHPILGVKKFVLSCLPNSDRLAEIILCMNLDATEFIDCPNYRRSFSCTNDIILKFYKTWSF